MNSRSTVRAACLLLVILSALSAPLSAQIAEQVTGSVQDQTGAPLAGVTITVRGASASTAETDATGAFSFGGLPPGDYAVTATLTGFEPVTRELRLQPGAAVSIALTLSVARLEHVVVTSAKAGDADIQSMPMAIGVVASDDLTRLAFRTVEQAAPLMPSVTFTQNSTFGQLSIRGIGTTAVNAGSDPSAAIYLDGVYLARPAMAFVELLDLDRIEVLRGPQGTLYGRNAVGGALNLISRAPTNDVDASARLTAGSLGELRAEGRLSGPLKRDRIMGSIAFARGGRDGYVTDLEHPDEPLGGDDLTAARGQLRFVFGRGADLLVASDVSDQKGRPLTYNKVLEVKPGFQVDNPPDLHEVRTSTRAAAPVRQMGTSVRLRTAMNPSTMLEALTAFRRLDNEYLVDADITELDILSAHVVERQHQWSEEVTVTHRRPRLTAIGGVFLFDEHDRQTVHADQPQANVRVVLDPHVDAGSAALFGQTTVGLTSKVSGTIGIRYTRERKTIDNAGGAYVLATGAAASPGYQYSDSLLNTAWTPKFGVDVTLPRRAMAYVTATKGFKTGGFNISSTQPGRGFGPEYAWSYEAGVKTEMLSGRARVNVAAFNMDYTDLQVQTPVGIGVFDIRNAAAATIRGIEIEGATRVRGGLEAGGHLTWLDAAYDRYIAVGTGGAIGDVAGNRLNNAPEWAGRLWAEWTAAMRTSRLTLTIDGSAQSTVFYTPFNDTIQRQLPYALVGLRAEYGPAHRRWAVNAYAKNVTNTGYVMATFATSPVAYGGRPGAPRQVGIQFIWQR